MYAVLPMNDDALNEARDRSVRLTSHPLLCEGVHPPLCEPPPQQRAFLLLALPWCSSSCCLWLQASVALLRQEQ
jgi:hypothetical protein